MIDFDTHSFTTGQVARAAGIPLMTLHTYFRRGNFRIIGDDAQRADRVGFAHLHNLRGAMQIAIAAKLIAMGSKPSTAFEAALAYSDSSGGRRSPGQQFDQREHGATFLLYCPDTKRALVKSGDELEGDKSWLYQPDPLGFTGAPMSIVPIWTIERQVFSALGLNASTADRREEEGEAVG